MTEQKSNGPQDIYKLPVFIEPDRKSVLDKYNQGVYTADDLTTYKAGTLLKEKGFADTPKDAVLHLYNKGYFSADQLNLYKEFHTAGKEYNPKNAFPMIALDMAIRGVDHEAIKAEVSGGLETPVYDPIDVGLDIATMGSARGIKTAAKVLWTGKGVEEAVSKIAEFGAKNVAKLAAKEVAIGATGGAAMAVIDEAGGGGLMQVLGGLLTPVGASALMTLGRQGLIRAITKAKRVNPELAAKVTGAIKAAPEAKVQKEWLAELDEAELDTTKPYEFAVPHTEAAPGKLTGDTGEPKRPLDFKDKGQIIDNTPLTRKQTEEIFKLVHEGAGNEALIMKQVMDVKGHGADLFRALDTVASEKGAKASGNRVPQEVSKAMGRDYLKSLTKFSDETGHRVLDLERTFVDAQDMAKTMQNMEARMYAHGSALVKLSATADRMIDAAVAPGATYTDALKAQEMISVFAEYDAAVRLVRSQYGRGTSLYNSKWRKTRWDFEGVPKEQMELASSTDHGPLLEKLKRFRKAKNLKDKRLLADDPNKFRFMRALNEGMVGAMMMLPKTWAKNIIGNTLSNMLYTTSRHLGSAIDVTADQWGKKFIAGLHGEGLAWEMAFKQLFTTPTWKLSRSLGESRLKAGLRATKSILKDMGSEEAGGFWKVLWSGEAQIDPYLKYDDAGSGGAIENAGRHLWKKADGTWARLPEWALRPVGEFMRIGLRMSAVGDEVFKTLGFNQRLNTHLIREAFQNGGPDKQLKTFLAERVGKLQKDDPILSRSAKEMRDMTFTTPLEGVAKDFGHALGNTRPGLAIKMFALPFYKIAVNLNKFAAKNSIVGLAWKETRTVLSTGTIEQKAEIISRMTLGTSAVAAGFTLYQNKMMTGRSDRRDWAAQNFTGAIPYAAVFADEEGKPDFQVDINQLDPASTLMAIGAGMAQTYDRFLDLATDDKTEQEFDTALTEVMSSAAMAFIEPTLNKSFMQSVNELVKFGTGESDSQKVATQQIRKFVPKAFELFNNVTGRADILRDVRSPLDVFWATLKPNELPPKRHSIYGTVLNKEYDFGGILRQHKTNDPVTQEMMRVGMATPPMERRLSNAGRTWELNTQQYSKLVGYLEDIDVKGNLQNVIDNYTRAGVQDDEFKRSQLQGVITDARNQAKAQFMKSEFGIPIKDDLMAYLKMRGEAMQGNKENRNPRSQFYKWLELGK